MRIKKKIFIEKHPDYSCTKADSKGNAILERNIELFTSEMVRNGKSGKPKKIARQD